MIANLEISAFTLMVDRHIDPGYIWQEKRGKRKRDYLDVMHATISFEETFVTIQLYPCGSRISSVNIHKLIHKNLVMQGMNRIYQLPLIHLINVLLQPHQMTFKALQHKRVPYDRFIAMLRLHRISVA